MHRFCDLSLHKCNKIFARFVTENCNSINYKLEKRQYWQIWLQIRILGVNTRGPKILDIGRTSRTQDLSVHGPRNFIQVFGESELNSVVISDACLVPNMLMTVHYLHSMHFRKNCTIFSHLKWITTAQQAMQVCCSRTSCHGFEQHFDTDTIV